MRRIWLTLGLMLAIALGGWWWQRNRLEEYRVFDRPDGRYRVVVLRQQVWLAAMPGQAGDAPGVVRLIDGKGKLLDEAPVEMVQLVEQVDWGDRTAEIPLIAKWELPD